MIVMVMPGLNYNALVKEGFHFLDTGRLVAETKTREQFVSEAADIIKGFDKIGRDVVMNASLLLSDKLQELEVKHCLVFCAMNARDEFIEHMGAVMSPVIYSVMSKRLTDPRRWVDMVQHHAVWNRGVPKICINKLLVLPTKKELERVLNGTK